MGVGVVEGKEQLWVLAALQLGVQAWMAGSTLVLVASCPVAPFCRALLFVRCCGPDLTGRGAPGLSL